MSDKPTTYSQACSMKPEEVVRIREMIAFHREFSAIEITVNSDRETYNSFQAERIPEEQVLVIFQIPCEGVNMPNFYKEFSEALNQNRQLRYREKEGEVKY